MYKQLLIQAYYMCITCINRSVGGIRISLYNAVELEETRILVDFMKDFMKRNKTN